MFRQIRFLTPTVLLFFAAVLVGAASAEPISERFKATDFDSRLFLDWLYQDVGMGDSPIFSDLSDGSAEEQLIEKVLGQVESESQQRGEELSDEARSQADALRRELSSLAREKTAGGDPRWRELYRRCCTLRRLGRLAETIEQAPRWIYATHFVFGGGHYTYTEDPTDAQCVEVIDRRDGGELLEAVLREDGTVQTRSLVKTDTGTLRDPDVDWDASRIVFSMRRSYTDDDYHLYEYSVSDGELTQLTFGDGLADIEPCYLPGGDILFGSTRARTVIDCWKIEVSNLFTLSADRQRIERKSFDQVTVNYPTMMPDGRVLYTRWDYNDRGQMYPQGLFVMNPDGTGQTAFYGNNSYFPTTILHARAIPDSSGNVLAIATGHHTRQKGKLLLIDRAGGTEENTGCHLIAPVRETPAEKVDYWGQTGEQFQYPYPVDDHNFVVSYVPEGCQNADGGEAYDNKFGLYWFDAEGRRELLVWDPQTNCVQAQPLQSRPRPTIRPSTIDDSVPTGRFYLQDVYYGPGLEGVQRGTIKKLRVVALEFRPAWILNNNNAGAAGEAFVCTPVGCDNTSWDVKHVLGEVPVEEDGSAYFEVPAKTPVYFQLLDEKGDVVQTMRSWSTLQPNEFFGCVGCHESKFDTAANQEMLKNGNTLALKKPPVPMKPVDDPPEGIAKNWGFSFMRDVQPILDRHCVVCHSGRADAKGGAAAFSLTAEDHFRPEEGKSAPCDGRLFSEAYWNLTGGGDRSWRYVRPIDVQGGPPMLPPYAGGAAVSPLMTLLRQGDENHKDLALGENEIHTIAAWIDLLLPYCGDYTEANEWDENNRALYSYYKMKRDVLDRWLADGGEVPGPSFGPGCLRQYIDDYLHREPTAVLTKKTGADNTERNVALNLDDVQGESTVYPHAFSNSEWAYAAKYAAKNVIDGKKPSGTEEIPCWSPNIRADA
ncbi:MAG: hypothetical protein IJG02_11540, partial [Thermoguttaceae bacterium]|nr:hypothetical protein [Thermoguttaceae bacterium]